MRIGSNARQKMAILVYGMQHIHYLNKSNSGPQNTLKLMLVFKECMTGQLHLDLSLRMIFLSLQMLMLFGMPTIYKWGGFMTRKLSGRRLFDRHAKYVTGGIHMTNSAFLPTAILKELTATESGYYNGFVNTAFLFNMTIEEMEEEQERLYNLHYRSCWGADTDSVEKSIDVKPYLPWFLECNPERFPYWFGKPDGRYQKMLEIMVAFRNKVQYTKQKEIFRKLFKRYFFPNRKNRLACNIMEISYKT